MLVFVAFGGLMSFMVYRCMKTPVNLVSAAYYRDEIAYQQVIDSREKANALQGKVNFSEATASIGLYLPADMKHKKITGDIVLYCAADARRDRQFTLQTDSAGFQSIPKKTLVPGSYIIKLSWQADSIRYYHEQSLTIH